MIISIAEASQNTIEIANGLSELKSPEYPPEPKIKNHKIKSLPQNNNNLKMLLKMFMTNLS
jgi:hypothetical protein